MLEPTVSSMPMALDTADPDVEIAFVPSTEIGMEEGTQTELYPIEENQLRGDTRKDDTKILLHASTHIDFYTADPDIEMTLFPRKETKTPEDTQLPPHLEDKYSENQPQEDAIDNETVKISCTLTITKTISKKGKTKIITKTRPKVLNNLLITVGFLDLASASDFAANVWNDYPTPIYATIFMILGGLFALIISYFALKDLLLSHPNYVLIRSERHLLKQERLMNLQSGLPVRNLDSCLEINFRELGNEIARLSNDVIMGSGVFLVGIGTLMAVGGKNPKVFRASNLLSGYIGNAPIAFFGLMNSAWSIYLWKKTYSHSLAGKQQLKGRKVGQLLERRTRLLRLYSALYGVAGFFTGVGSLISATMWFGYVISLPWIGTAVFCNYLWRMRIGYDRATIQDMDTRFFTKEGIVRDIEDMSFYKSKLTMTTAPATTLSMVVLENRTITETIQFLVKYDLFTEFCVKIIEDEELRMGLFGDGVEYKIDAEAFNASNIRFQGRIMEMARLVVDERGLWKFKQRKRFLVEALGCFLCAGEEFGRDSGGGNANGGGRDIGDGDE